MTIALTFAVLVSSNCGYNSIQEEDEAVTASWAEVLNQYQRRADLIPNLVNTVKGYAAQEEKVLTEVTRVRAGVGSIQADEKTLNNPELFKKIRAGSVADDFCAFPFACGGGKLSGVKIQPKLPRSSGAA